MSTICKGTTKTGAPCSKKTCKDHGYCHLHEDQAITTTKATTQCKGKTKAGERCMKNVKGDFCHLHRDQAAAPVCAPCDTPAVVKKSAVVCGAKCKDGSTCAKKTSDLSGKCHLHKAAAERDGEYTSGMRAMMEADGKPMSEEHYDRMCSIKGFRSANGRTYEDYMVNYWARKLASD